MPKLQSLNLDFGDNDLKDDLTGGDCHLDAIQVYVLDILNLQIHNEIKNGQISLD